MSNFSAAALVHQARLRAAMSQTELGRRAGVAQSVVSAYEAGRREPSLPMLLKLIEATGHQLDLRITPVPDLSSASSGMLLSRVKDRRAEVELIAAKYGAKNLRVFGSAARGEDKEGSDIDLVVDFDEGAGLMALAGLERELADLLEVAVDVVPSNSLKPRVRVAVDREAVAL